MVDWNFKNQSTEIQHFWWNQTTIGHSDFIHLDTYFPDPISWPIQNSSTNLHVKLMNTSDHNSFKSKIWCFKEAPSFSKYYECWRGRSTTQLFDNRKRMEWDYYAETSAFEATEARDARFFAKLSLRCSRCSLRRNASSFWYSAASFLALTILFFLIAILRRFLCRVTGVTSRWILGALLLFFPAITENPTHAYKQYFNRRQTCKLANSASTNTQDNHNLLKDIKKKKPLKLPNKTWCTRWRWGPGPEKTEFSFSPVEETNVRRYVFTYFLTSSSLVRLKSLRILVALLGPLILGFSVSVSPGRWLSPGSHQVITVIQNFSQSTSNQAMT